MSGFIRNTKYYTGVVYEWNLPVGVTCPFARECLVTVDRWTGKFDTTDGAFRCYASSAERFPGVREHRWQNFEFVTEHQMIPELPKKAKHVRIHVSGDFFAQWYFDLWLRYCRNHPDVRFWAFTKSIRFWVNRLDSIPKNLILTASYGGKQDNLIEANNLKWAKVIRRPEDREIPYYPIDNNDDWARTPDHPFYLLDNKYNSKKEGK